MGDTAEEMDVGTTSDAMLAPLGGGARVAAALDPVGCLWDGVPRNVTKSMQEPRVAQIKGRGRALLAAEAP